MKRHISAKDHFNIRFQITVSTKKLGITKQTSLASVKETNCASGVINYAHRIRAKCIPTLMHARSFCCALDAVIR